MNNNKAIQHPSELLSPLLDDFEKTFLLASRKTPIKRMGKEEKFRGILQAVNRGFLELGTLPMGNSDEERDKSLAALTNLIIIDIEDYFPTLTMDELTGAIRRGLRNEYGKFFGFNVISVHKFIEAYLEDEIRIAAIKKQRRFLLEAHEREQENQLTLEQKWDIMRNGIIHQYEKYKATKVLEDWGNATYDFFDRAGIIALTVEEKKVIYAEAEERVKAENLMRPGMAMDTLLMAMRRNNQEKEKLVKSKAKQISLAQFYDTNPDIAGLMKSVKLFEVFCEPHTKKEPETETEPKKNEQ